MVRDFAAGHQATIDAAEASIAVLDPAGTIIAVNAGWLEFGRANGRPDPESDIGRPYPTTGLLGIGDVIRGPSLDYSTVYPCHSPTQQRWFRVLASRIDHALPAACLVIHRRLIDSPSRDALVRMGDEIGLRLQGIRTVCAWCERHTRDLLGRWVPGLPEPGHAISHGLCTSCARGLLDETDLLTA